MASTVRKAHAEIETGRTMMQARVQSREPCATPAWLLTDSSPAWLAAGSQSTLPRVGREAGEQARTGRVGRCDAAPVYGKREQGKGGICGHNGEGGRFTRARPPLRGHQRYLIVIV